MVLEVIVPAVVAGVIRNVSGFLENAMSDGTLSGFEIAQLGGTIVSVVVISLGTYYAFDLSGVGAAASGLLVHFLAKKLDKIRIGGKQDGTA